MLKIIQNKKQIYIIKIWSIRRNIYKNIKYFRRIFMRDTLPKKVKNMNNGIVHLDSIDGNETYWLCYYNKII